MQNTTEQPYMWISFCEEAGEVRQSQDDFRGRRGLMTAEVAASAGTVNRRDKRHTSASPLTAM